MTNYDIIRYLTDQAGREEVAQIEAWIEESRENKILFERWKSVWEAANAIVPTDVPDTDQAWSRVQAKLVRKPVSLYRRLRYIAAAVALLLGLGYYGWHHLSHSALAFNEVVTSINEMKEVDLPDGSTVWLNGNSSIQFPEQFSSNERRLQIVGHAHFQVKHDATKPFIVDSRGSHVQVLGTSFSVYAHPDSTEIIVNVESGRVALFSDQKTIEDALILNKSEQGTLNLLTKQLVKDSIADQNYLAWQHKNLVFDNTPLNEVAIAIEKAYHVSISIRNPALNDCTFTGSYEAVSLEEILEMFSILFDAKIEQVATEYMIVDGKGC